MMFTLPVKEFYRKKLPAITQVNGMAEVQTVDKNQHTYFWRLLDKFEQITGSPILLNAPFNISHQPICSINEAIDNLVMNLDMDGLFIENYFFYKIKEKESIEYEHAEPILANVHNV